MSLNSVFDIETAPLDLETVLARTGEFCEADHIAKNHPGEFHESQVKIGNLKDAAKIAAKVEEARAQHAARLKDFELSLPMAAKEHEQNAMETAALSAITGRVIAIGFADDSAERINLIDDYDDRPDDYAEVELLKGFWQSYQCDYDNGARLIGVNIHRFDLPFLYQRSLLLGVEIPPSVLERGRYWSPTFIDLCALWTCGQNGGYVSFDTLCRAFDLPGKQEIEVDGEIVEGKNYWKFARSENPEHREAAKKYLLNDIKQPREVARRMGLF